MIVKDRTIANAIKNRAITEDELTTHIMENYPMTAICRELARLLLKSTIQPITITPQEFDAHFRIQGLKADGSQETRGRKRKGDFDAD